MPDRETLIRNIDVGDIFHAECPNGASLICLATAVNDTTIDARVVTTQVDLEFSRKTGVAESSNYRAPCTINSVAPLPPEIHDIFLDLDHRYRTSTDPERSKLSQAEIDAIMYIDKYYPENPI
jgi:hypothetical protein